MERKVVDFIAAAEKLCDIRNLSNDNPVILRMSFTSLSSATVAFCGMQEPKATHILPLNTLWIDFNPLSLNYRRVLKRTSKAANPSAGTLFTWVQVSKYNVLFEPQYFDDADLAIIGANINIGPATTVAAGIARLSVAAVDPANPIVVGDGDPRLTDARAPLPHTHPPQPIDKILTATGFISIRQDVVPQPGMVLYCVSDTEAEWRFLVDSDIKVA